ncbi:DUF6271 family protein [Streptosporangium sp. NPDC005286]|uniref:DUF6271 family protein n=1 Tax=Streptosporangium sp. NPDC005286 TaxID=3154463 RepID=UPI0033B63A4A
MNRHGPRSSNPRRPARDRRRSPALPADEPADRDRLERLLIPEGVSYGAGPNIAALVAVALDAQVLLRRDSPRARCRAGRSSRFPESWNCARQPDRGCISSPAPTWEIRRWTGATCCRRDRSSCAVSSARSNPA